MKLTKSKLKHLIKEELDNILNERKSALGLKEQKNIRRWFGIPTHGPTKRRRRTPKLSPELAAKLEQFLSDRQVPEEVQVWVDTHAKKNVIVARSLAFYFIPTYYKERAVCAASGGKGGVGNLCDNIARIMALQAYNNNVVRSRSLKGEVLLRHA